MFAIYDSQMDGLEVLSGLCVPKDTPAEIQHKFNALVVQLFRTDAALLESRIYIDYMMNSLLPCIVSLIVNLRVGSAHLLQVTIYQFIIFRLLTRYTM